MKINDNKVFAGDVSFKISSGVSGENKALKGKSKGSTVDGTTIRAKFDPIEAKKEEAKKKAMKIVGDAFSNDIKMDRDLELRKAKVKDLERTKAEATTAIADIERNRAALKSRYKVDDESREEKDLKLLEKEIKAKMPGSEVTLTEKEKKEIARLKEDGLTDYQKQSLEMLESEIPYAMAEYDAEQNIKIENQIISASKIERLKSSPMLSAVQNASAIMSAASSEVIDIVIDQARDHMDEEKEKQEKKAEASKEAREEMEERIDSIKAKREEEEEFIQDVIEEVKENTSKTTEVEGAQQELKNMLNKLKLIEEDIKGAAVDTVL